MKRLTNLQPCPFCNWAYQHVVSVSQGLLRANSYAVLCMSCEARGPLMPSHEAALEAWNARRSERYAQKAQVIEFPKRKDP